MKVLRLGESFNLSDPKVLLRPTQMERVALHPDPGLGDVGYSETLKKFKIFSFPLLLKITRTFLDLICRCYGCVPSTTFNAFIRRPRRERDLLKIST